MRCRRGALHRLRTPAFAVVVAATMLPTAAQAASGRQYIVQLKAPPLASYTGGRSGIPATSPKATGQRKLSTTSGAARQYRTYLADRERSALARVPGGRPAVAYSYGVAFAGFAARLTPGQVTALRRAPEVARVLADAKARVTAIDPDTVLGGGSSNPLIPDGASHLGLSKSGGLWDRLGGYDQAGNGIVVGDIDSGITPQHPSFADDPSEGYIGSAFGPPPSSWHGTCQPGIDATDGPPTDPARTDPALRWTASTCGNKLIGARYYFEGFGAEHLAPDSFLSARDDDGHGTHTSSTAAGNFGVDPSILGSALGVDRISGIAPRARIAEYKVCWVGGDVADGCANSDSIKAIDDAVADGVDVINYSVGSSSSAVIGAVEYAYLGASDAGVFVSNSAGNDGPGTGTVGSPAAVPWLTTVAAGTLARTFEASATITPSSGSPFTIKGASVTGPLGTITPIVDAEHAPADPGVAAIDAARCQPDSLDPATVAGKVVLCIRGDNARIDKSKVVQDAGGVGMILYNTSDAQETVTDTHYVPTVHVSNSDGLRVKAAVAAGTTTATITRGAAVPGPGAVLAAFSSRGPQTAVADLAKPDVEAPGVNILAGASPNPAQSTELPPGQLYQSISGTSMAAPHVAGAGALLKQAHPSWDPAMIKSALMTTADPDVKAEDGTSVANPFQAGSGEIDPTSAAAASLVLDANTSDYVRYIDSIDPSIFGATQEPIAPSDLNLPSISSSRAAGTFSTVRRFTSTDGATRRWAASISVPGFSAQVSQGPAFLSEFSIGPGQSIDLDISATRTSAPLNAYAYGALVLTSGSQTLRLPVSLQPIALAAPPTISLTTDKGAGSQDVALQAGFSGTVTALGWGLAAPDVSAAQTISATSGSPVPDGSDPGTDVYDVTVPAGAQLVSGRIANVDDGDPNADLDLFLYRDANDDGAFTEDELIDLAASGSATEKLTEVLPAAGAYRFAVVGFTTRSPSTTYDFSTWVVDDGSPDDVANAPGIALTGDPLSVSIGQRVSGRLEYSAVDEKGLYLGVATFHDSASPTLSNVVGKSVVELSKTADTVTPVPTPPPAVQPPPATPPPALPPPIAAPAPPIVAPAPKPAVKKLAIKSVLFSRGRTALVVRLRLTARAKVSITVMKGGRVVARGKARSIAAGTRTVRFALDRRLRQGTYTVSVLATSASSKEVRSTWHLKVGR
jgi:subtilisin family serine protease